MSEKSRLGREQIETAYALKQLIQAGVRVFFYLEDRERTLDSPTDKLMLSVSRSNARRRGAAHPGADAAGAAKAAGRSPHVRAADGATASPGDDGLLPGEISPPYMVTPAGFEPAISTLKGSRPGPG
jgi:hypothetical protein